MGKWVKARATSPRGREAEELRVGLQGGPQPEKGIGACV